MVVPPGARISSQTYTAPNAAAGVMLRERLTPDSRFAFVFTTPAIGAGMTYRTTVGGLAAPDGLQRPGVAAPYWLRLVRKWSEVTYYLSADGISWSECGKVKLSSLRKTVYIGLAVSSLVDGVLGSASFDNVWIVGSTTGAP